MVKSHLRQVGWLPILPQSRASIKDKDMTNNSKYWDIYRTLTHNALFYFIVGNRSGGKSFGCKEYAIKNFITKGEQFGYVRRTKDDLKDSAKEFFKDVSVKFPDYEFKVDGNKFYCRLSVSKEKAKVQPWTENDICGYGFNLTTASNRKSIPYPKITFMMFDEFLIDNEGGNQRFIKNEPRALFNLYETVARPGTDHPRVIMFLLANSTSVNNPYFLYLDLKCPDPETDTPDKNGKFIWHHPTRPILVENAVKQAMVDAKQQTEFYQVIKGTGYDDFSIKNKFINDDDTFVEKRDSTAIPYFRFWYKGQQYGVWLSMSAGLMWVSAQYDPGYPIVYSLTMKDHKPNTLFLKNKNQAKHFNTFIQAYKDGLVRFESVLIKSICYEVIKLTMNV